MNDKNNALALEKRHTWHPFTPMHEWCAPDHEPLILTSGQGVWLTDIDGLSYIDGNSSIWTNIHGHRHPRIDAAIKAQIERFAHVSFLGATHPGAIELASRLVDLWAPSDLSRVFLSDNGSTAMEVALKMSVQYWQLEAKPERNRFVSFEGGYHGDTAGVSSLGGIARFHDRFRALHFDALHVSSLQDLTGLSSVEVSTIAAVVIEPLIQGAGGMRLWPEGTLRAVRDWCDQSGAFLIADEVMTGFGRTGRMFACQQEDVEPDFVALAKGLTAGYLPLAATMVSERIYEAFLGEPIGERTLYYGHSYTANALGCASALANLDVFEDEATLAKLAPKIDMMNSLLKNLEDDCAWVREVRQCGFISGIEIAQLSGEPFSPSARMGARVCAAARRHGLLTRPIHDVIVLMPPLCIAEQELLQAVQAIALAIDEECPAAV